MSDKTHTPDPRAVALLEQTLELAEDGWKAAHSEHKARLDLQARYDALEQEKVRLEKVAGQSAPEIDEAQLSQTLDLVETVPGLQVKDREKLASLLREDPNKALELIDQVITTSTASRSEGRGVSKTAGSGNGEGEIAGHKNGIPVHRDPHGFCDVILHQGR